MPGLRQSQLSRSCGHTNTPAIGRWAMRALTRSTSSIVIRPSATPRWLVTTTTRQPSPASIRTACSAPSRNRNRSGVVT